MSGLDLRAATTSTLLGIATAAVFAAWHPVHSWLFGGYVHYSGTEPAPAAYMLRAPATECQSLIAHGTPSSGLAESGALE